MNLRYASHRRRMEVIYKVRIELHSELRDDGLWHAVAGAWIGKECVDETCLLSTRKTGDSKAESVIACLNELEPPLNRRWKQTHFDDITGQYYMFAFKPKQIGEE